MSAIGSLGFNPNRRHPSTNLPGSINAVYVGPRVQRQRRVQPSKEVAVVVPRRVPPREEVVVQPPPPPPNASADADAAHWVYATVGPEQLRSASDTTQVVSESNARVLLVYPMAADPDTGVVSMMMKTVDAGTGQLALQWVRIYDPNTDTRYVSQFSLLP